MYDFAAFNEVYTKYFAVNPAHSCVAVKALSKEILVEAEVMAYINVKPNKMFPI